MKLDYILLRMTRHFLPDPIVRLLLDRQWIIKPGVETRLPEQALDRFKQDIERLGIQIKGKRVMIFGYGGKLDLALGILKLGAGQIVLCEKSGFPAKDPDQTLQLQYPEYLEMLDGKIIPKPGYVIFIHGDIHELVEVLLEQPIDLVISSSVYEHLDDVLGITQILSSVTSFKGTHIHYIDLRDHFFKYPFEMLTYSQNVWEKWLNPTSNLNRLRSNDYQKIFEEEFEKVDVDILEQDLPSFIAVQTSIRKEYISGDPGLDAATQIRVVSTNPRR